MPSPTPRLSPFSGRPPNRPRSRTWSSSLRTLDEEGCLERLERSGRRIASDQRLPGDPIPGAGFGALADLPKVRRDPFKDAVPFGGGVDVVEDAHQRLGRAEVVPGSLQREGTRYLTHDITTGCRRLRRRASTIFELSHLFSLTSTMGPTYGTCWTGDGSTKPPSRRTPPISTRPLRDTRRRTCGMPRASHRGNWALSTGR
jgi:hypothetical protein